LQVLQNWKKPSHKPEVQFATLKVQLFNVDEVLETMHRSLQVRD
jgi:hypothetical protein